MPTNDTDRRGRRTAPALTALAAALLLGLGAAGPAAAADGPSAPPSAPAAFCHQEPAACAVASATASATASGPRTPSPTAKPTAKPTPTGKAKHKPEAKGTDWTLPGLVAGILVLLLGGLAVAVRRSGGTPQDRRRLPPPPAAAPPAPRAAPEAFAATAYPRPARTRPATVGTDLHPQGYVDIDQCLHRAVWADPAGPPPAPGAPVAVAHPDPDDATQDPAVLLAFPADPQRSQHA